MPMNLFEKPHHKEECQCDECWRWMTASKQELERQLYEMAEARDAASEAFSQLLFDHEGSVYVACELKKKKDFIAELSELLDCQPFEIKNRAEQLRKQLADTRDRLNMVINSGQRYQEQLREQLAAYEKDHAAMEVLRAGVIELGHRWHAWKLGKCPEGLAISEFSADPAEAILQAAKAAKGEQP